MKLPGPQLKYFQGHLPGHFLSEYFSLLPNAVSITDFQGIDPFIAQSPLDLLVCGNIITDRLTP